MLKIALFSFLFTSLSFAKTFSVMTYNLENLFDDRHDENKKDWTYLPLYIKESDPAVYTYCQTLSNRYYRSDCYNLDWNYQVMTQKMINLSRVISSYDNGRGPDIAVFQEVENYRALKLMNDVGKLGYPYIVVLEGPDERGIDVGILSRFPIKGKSKLHTVDLSQINKKAGKRNRPTRSILEVTLDIEGHPLTIFGNHWPSQAHKDEARVEAAKVLLSKARNKRGAVLAVGDFNTDDKDRPHGINNFLLNRSKGFWFYDAREMSKKNFPGSHWYRGEWAHLDRIFIARNSVGEGCRAQTCLQPQWSSFEVMKPYFAVKDHEWGQGKSKKGKVAKDIPWRYDPENQEGYTDHLPVVMKFKVF